MDNRKKQKRPTAQQVIWMHSGQASGNEAIPLLVLVPKQPLLHVYSSSGRHLLQEREIKML